MSHSVEDATSAEPNIDRVVISSVGNHRRDMSRHYVALLDVALTKTQEEYGPFELKLVQVPLVNMRAFKEFGKPKQRRKINTHVTIYAPERAKQGTVIEIPVVMGLLNYRLIVYNKKDAKKFENLSSLEDLKKNQLGTVSHWVITRILEENNFSLVKGYKTTAIYHMLNKGRYEYLLRGMSEVFTEKDDPENNWENLVIDPNYSIYLPLPYYFYIAPDEKRLKARIEKGLEMMLADGSMQNLLMLHFGDAVKRAQLANKKVFYVRNPMLSDAVAKRSDLWYFSNENFKRFLQEEH